MESKNGKGHDIKIENENEEEEIVDVMLNKDLEDQETVEQEDRMIEIRESELRKLKEELEENKKATKEAQNNLLYAQADFENYKKIFERDKQDFLCYAEKDLLLKFIDFVDDFERALSTISNSTDNLSALEAYELLHKQLQSLLEKQEVKPIEAISKLFDPYLHEVMMGEETDEVEEGTILEEFKKGYYLKNKVLRHSLVKIAKRTKKE